METTKRFENAVMKLYNAFHENRLEAYDCTACAVGNICNNTSEWAKMTIPYRENGSFSQEVVEGYSIPELAEIEYRFMFGRNKKHSHLNHLLFKSGEISDFGLVKDVQFKGLCAVVEYLAELDNIPNPMDYSKLFETNNDKPIYELKEVF